MTPLRQRMLDALQVRGMAVRTQQAYIDAVARLALHYRRAPDVLSAEQVQAYLLHLRRERKLSCSTLNQYGCAFRFFYASVLGRDGAAFQIPLSRAPQRLPEVLSRDEIARLLAVACHAKSRSFLMLAYGTGMRLSELCALRVEHIDSAADRMCIRVVAGKGGKDRYVPLAPDVLEVLRAWWRIARPQQWVFSAARQSAQRLDAKTPQRWYRAACAHAGITKRGGIHTLRHCWATHLLEAGVDLHSLSQWLGHNHVSTSTRYLHLARPDAPEGARREPLALLSALPPLTTH
jgi:integrase/recombinase XerD